jgi:hypothetical protein
MPHLATPKITQELSRFLIMFRSGCWRWPRTACEFVQFYFGHGGVTFCELSIRSTEILLIDVKLVFSIMYEFCRRRNVGGIEKVKRPHWQSHRWWEQTGLIQRFSPAKNKLVLLVLLLLLPFFTLLLVAGVSLRSIHLYILCFTYFYRSCTLRVTSR